MYFIRFYPNVKTTREFTLTWLVKRDPLLCGLKGMLLGVGSLYM